MADILIIMNNYFHDVATAVLIAAAAIMWALDRVARTGAPGDVGMLARAYPILTRFAVGALVWIVVGGVPRVVFFNTHDLGAINGDLVPAIAVKHVVEVAAVIAGAVMWRRVKHRVLAVGESAARGGE